MWIDCNPRMDKYIHYIHYNAWDEITYPFPNFYSYTIQEWISNFMSHFSAYVIT